MAQRIAIQRRMFVLALAVVSTLATVTVASAAEPLRWKFEPGQKLNYQMTQDTDIKMNAGAAGNVNTTMKQVMDMTWDVQQVDDKGNATIKQSFKRVQMKMGMPGNQNLEYDSASEAEPVGLAALVAPMFQAMIANAIDVTMSPRGEIINVEVPEAMVDAIKNSPGAAAMGDMASKEGFQRMLEQGALTLPENVPTEGEEWTTKVEMNNPMAGKQTVETTYRYVGTREVGGDTMAVVEPKVKMTIEGAGQGGMTMNVKDQEATGEILFNSTEGRLDSSKMNQDMTFEIAMGEQTMEQQIKQTISIKVSETDEAAPEATKVE